jgi:hypothetical protein
MTLLYIIAAFLIGLFLPSPFSTLVRGWVLTVWAKIKSMFNKNDKGGTKSCGCSGC